MKSPNLLDQYRQERNMLLEAISARLERDLAVRAAWLFGSLGRGEADEFSDVDMWVVVEDANIESFIASPRAYASQIGNPILFVDAPQNAPQGGAYLMACYDAPVAPHIVDWYWQPLSLAYIPDQVRLLFDRVGLSRHQQAPQFKGGPANKEIIERPMHFIGFFWMMLMITAKYAARFPGEERMPLLPFLVDSIAQAQCFLGKPERLHPQGVPAHPSPAEKIRLLYRLADQMSELMAGIAARGEAVPELVTPGAYRYLGLVEWMLQSE